MNFFFRFRYVLHPIIFVLGFLAPWDYLYHVDAAGPSAHVWGLLAVQLSRSGALGIGQAFHLVLSLGIFFAAAAAWLRTWGAAYLNSSVVHSAAMHTAEAGNASRPTAAPRLYEDGPFRHLRNPLYVGTVLHTLALVLLMPVSGAIFSIVAIVALQIVLILGEERFLTRELGPAYQAYGALVPRVWPRLRAKLHGTGARAHWLQAFGGETYFWGVASSFAIAGWWSNAQIMDRCVLVSLGISLVARAFIKPPATGPAATGNSPALTR